MKTILFLFFLIYSHTSYGQIIDSSIIINLDFNKSISNSSSNIISDLSSYKNNGIIIGNSNFIEDRFGNKCSAFNFDGSTFIKIPNSSSLNSIDQNITISVWFKISSGADFFNQWITICCKGDNSVENTSNPHFRMQATAQTISLNSNMIFNAVPQLKYEKWYHYVYSFNGKKFLAYLDGVPFFQVTTPYFLSPNNLDLDIGRDLPGKEEFFNGAMDDLLIFNKFLSESEVKNIFKNGSLPSVDCESSNNKILSFNETKLESFESVPVEIQDTAFVKSLNIEIYPFDNKMFDQDSIDLIFNDNYIVSKYLLTNEIFPVPQNSLFKLTLSNNSNNFLISKALNLGKNPPNTLSLKIFDGFSEQIFYLNSKLDKFGVLQIIPEIE